MTRTAHRLLSALLIGGLLFTTFGLSVARPANAAAPITLKYLNWFDASGAKLVAQATKEYTALHPEVQIVQNSVAGTGAATYPNVLRTGIAGGRPPDFFNMWGGQIASPFIDDGQVLDLTPYYEKYGWNKIIEQWPINAIKRKGRVWGVPFTARGMGLWYHKDMFARLGIAVPTTYAQVEAACAKLKTAHVYCAASVGKYGWHLMRLLDYFIEVAAGPTLHDQLNAMTVSWDRPEVVKAYAMLKKWVDNQWLPPGFMAVSPGDAQLAFNQGKAAMILEGDWEEGALKTAGQDTKKYAYFLPPTGHTPLRFSAFPEQLMIAKGAAHPNAAAAFINWYIQPAVQRKYFAVSGSTATIGAFPAINQWPLTYKWRHDLDTHSTYPPSDQAFNKEFMDGTFFRIQAAVVSGQTAPADAGKQMQSSVDAMKQANS